MAKRRGNGEGSIYKRKDGRWTATFKDTLTGKRAYLYADTRAQVRKDLAERVSRRDHGLMQFSGDQHLRDFLDDWLTTKKLSLEPNTYVSYDSGIRRHLSPVIGEIKLKDLKPSHVQLVMSKMTEKKLSPGRMHLIGALLRSALDYAIELDLIPKNVAKSIPLPRVEQGRPRSLDQDQALRLIEAVSQLTDPKLRAAIILSLTTGIRQGEMLALTLADFDFTNHTVRISRSVQRIGASWRVKVPKTKAGLRTLPLTLLAERFIKDLTPVSSADFLFSEDGQTPWHRKSVLYHFCKIRDDLGIPSTLNYRNLRHSCATLLLTKNVHPKIVSELLGHASISITLGIYSDVLPSAARSAATQMDELLSA